MRLRRRFLPVFLPLFFWAALASEADRALPTPPDDSMQLINQTELRKHLEFLSSPEVGGRHTISAGLRVTNRYLASRLRAFGFHPAVGESFLQEYEVKQVSPDPDDSSFTVTDQAGASSFEYGDFYLSGGREGVAEGEIVFVGYGIHAPELGRDDYKGLDVGGKIVLVLPGLPQGIDESQLSDEQHEAGAAEKAGAVGMLTFPSPRFAAFVRNPRFREMVRSRSRLSLNVPEAEELTQITLTSVSSEALLAEIGVAWDDLYAEMRKGTEYAPRTLSAKASWDVRRKVEVFTVANVVGILDGTDPADRNEYVAISAHSDHLATNARGEIYPGADDDGSGTAAVLTIARAMAAQPARRSILAIFHSGEEEGLLGSRYNTDIAPAVPLEQIVADLNIDMIGRSRTEDDQNPRRRDLTDDDGVHVIGADRISTELNEINEQTNRDFSGLEFDYRFNDPTRPERYYFRSDHWNYAKHGVPVVFFFTGVHEDYHRPTDTIDKIDFVKYARITRHVYALGWRLANMDHRLRIDKE